MHTSHNKVVEYLLTLGKPQHKVVDFPLYLKRTILAKLYIPIGNDTLRRKVITLKISDPPMFVSSNFNISVS